jgi:hypothetical protein
MPNRMYTIALVALLAACGDPLPNVEVATDAPTGAGATSGKTVRTTQASVREAASRTYIHGMTRQIAEQEVGRAGVPTLLQLLDDPSFERRDNVVAMLGFLVEDAEVEALVQQLRTPKGNLNRPEDLRAVLLVPQVLGHAAVRGNDRALEVLMEITADAQSPLLSAATASHPNPAALRADLLEMAVLGLAHSERPAAAVRLGDIAAVKIRPQGTDLGLRAVQVRRQVAQPNAGLTGLDGSPDTVTPPPVADAQTRVHDSPLTYSNHPDVAGPMTDVRLDAVLDEANLRAGRADFGTDIACCISASRSGSAQTFGTTGDGLDTLSTDAELTAVLNDGTSRMKVVTNISWCGGAGTNIIGCAWVGGNGGAVVRMSSLINESILWIHEYGHNTGLNHASDSRFLMYGSVTGNNNGMSQADCNQYHSPASGTQQNVVDGGACTDVDGDDVHDVLDNCPAVNNTDQLDANANGVGDACEGGECGNGILEPGEDCDGADLGGAACSDNGCSTGTPTCALDCTVDYGACGGCPVCDNNGTCDAGEDCDSCPNDCPTGAGASCGNGICEAGNGEDCLSCAADCRGKQNGRRNNRYCCGDGAGENPLSCSNSTCTNGEWQCTNTPASPSCCGDASCDGAEDGNSCPLDCGAPPACGDGTCNGNETICTCSADCGTPPGSETSCTNGNDDDCDAAVDCNDSDCSGDPACSCGQPGSSCSTSGDCCSNSCKGKRGNKTCR